MKAFLIFLTFTFWTSLFGQNPNYYTLTKNDGLPSNGIYDIYQDTRGFMWFATQKGLSKFDGSSFKTYTLKSQSNVAGSAISEDQYGRIWYCNFDGFLFYVENNILKALPQKETNGYFKFGIIKNRLFLIQKEKVIIYDLATLKIVKSIPFTGDKIYSTFSDQSSFYVLADLLLQISVDGTTKQYSLPPDFQNEITAVVLQKSKNDLIIVSKDSKKYYLFCDNKFIKYQLPQDFKLIQNVSSVDGYTLLCTTAGIYRVDTQKENAPVKKYFSDFNITTVFKDSQNNYWFGTQNKGLLLVPDLQSVIIPLSSRPLKIAAYNDNFLVSTDQDELFLFSPADHSVKKFYQGTTKHPINQLTVNRDNNSVYFTSSHFNILKTNTEVPLRTFMAVKDVKKIDEKYYSYAASGNSGIFSVNNSMKSKWDSYIIKQNTDKARFGQTSILQNSNGKCTIFNPENNCIYFGTNQGLFYKTLAATKELKLNGESLYITNMAIHKSSVFALSTNGNLLKISADQKITPMQLPANIKKGGIFRIKIIDDTLFLITENALWQYNLVTNSAKMLLYGIQNLDLTDLEKSKEGLLLLTAQGLLITPGTKPLETRNPAFIFTEVLANDKPVAFADLKKLEHDQTNIRVNFAVLAFIPGHQPEISYRINDEKWQTLEKSSRSLLLSTLQHGNYNLEFRTKTGEVFSEIYQLKFSIEKPFYLKPLFLIFAILLASLAIYSVFAYRLKKIRAQNELALEKISLERNLNLSKLKAIKSQMNPHFFYNALNTIQAYILSNEKKLAVGYLSKFSLLTRTILEMTEKDYVTVSEEIKILNLYLGLEKVRFNDDFEFEINSSEDEEIFQESIPTLFLQPYIENALKHGLLHKKGSKKLDILFEKSNDSLLITIKDNGIGRQKSAALNALRSNKPQPFATEAMNKRVDLLNTSETNKIEIRYEDHFDENGDSIGTTVYLKFPIN